MAIILPHGVLFRGGAEERIRTKLLKDGCYPAMGVFSAVRLTNRNHKLMFGLFAKTKDFRGSVFWNIIEIL